MELRGSATANTSEEKDNFSPAGNRAGKRQEMCVCGLYICVFLFNEVWWTWQKHSVAMQTLGNKKMALRLHGWLLLVSQPDKVNGPWWCFVTNRLKLSLKVTARWVPWQQMNLYQSVDRLKRATASRRFFGNLLRWNKVWWMWWNERAVSVINLFPGIFRWK